MPFFSPFGGGATFAAGNICFLTSRDVWWCTRARSGAGATALWAPGRRTASSPWDHVVNRPMSMGSAMMLCRCRCREDNAKNDGGGKRDFCLAQHIASRAGQLGTPRGTQYGPSDVVAPSLWPRVRHSDRTVWPRPPGFPHRWVSAEATGKTGTNAKHRPALLHQLTGLPAVPHGFRNSSGSFATLAAIRRASSFVSNLAADRRPGSSS